MQDLEGAPAAFAHATLCAGFQTTVAERGDTIALRTRGDAVAISWREYGERVRRIAGGLAALGVKAGDTVAILMSNRPEFNLVDTAAIHLGAVPFSMYVTSSVEQLRYLLADAGAKIAFTERALEATLRAAAAGTEVETIVLIDEHREAGGVGALPASPVGRGRSPLGVVELDALPAPPAGFDFDATWRAVPPEALLTIIYTSGTTGPPKGVEITHANMMFELNALLVARPAYDDTRVISYLPHAHIADRTATHYIQLLVGGTVTACPDPRQLFELVVDAQPTEFTGVPRVWEKLKAGLEAKFGAEPPERQAMIQGAIGAAVTKVKLEQAGQPVPAPLAEGVARAEAMMFAPLRAKLGFASTRQYFVGAAPTPLEVLQFFHALGMPIAEVWGMSELSCVATAMPQGQIRLGTVGKALPGVEIKLAEDGEVMVRGPVVMKGYRNQPAQTAETIDADGWLRTGDIGELDADGFLKIVDRKKELIINAAGKNMSPANIEARIKTSSPVIGQACVIGDMRPYNVALIVLDPDGAAAFTKARGADAIAAEIDRAVAAANAQLSRVEQIKRYALLSDEWLPGGDELTPTMKLRRKPIAAKYAARIDALYAD